MMQEGPTQRATMQATHYTSCKEKIGIFIPIPIRRGDRGGKTEKVPTQA